MVRLPAEGAPPIAWSVGIGGSACSLNVVAMIASLDPNEARKGETRRLGVAVRSVLTFGRAFGSYYNE